MSFDHVKVVKQAGARQSEAFDPDKLAGSIIAACHSVSLPDGVAHDTAKHVVRALTLWLGNKQEVTSDDIRRVATETLAIVSPEAGYIYQHQHTIL